MSVLPEGWVSTALANITAKIGSGATPRGGEQSYKTSGVPLIRSLNIHFDGIREDGLAFLDDEQASKLDNVTVQENDVLLNITGASIGRVAIATKRYSGARVNQHVCIIRMSEGIDPHYVCNFLASPSAQESIGHVKYGITRPALTKSVVEGIVLPIPPLAEQKRIVAKVEALSASSARTRAEIARVEALVSRYKQALLRNAFSGELIGQSPTATSKLHVSCWDLPAGWRWVMFKDAVEIASDLVDPKGVPDLPHIAPDNIESGTGHLLPYRTIGEDGVISAKHRFFPGQILYSKIRPYLRKAVIVDFTGACSADIYPLTPRANLCGRFLLYWLVSEQFTQFAVEHQGRTVLPKINQKALNGTPLPLPTLAEQSEIVRRIDFAMTRMDRAAAEARRALRLLTKLDHAILAKAFRGELVTQDNNDEPAERLLARIRVERDTAPKVKLTKYKRETIMATAEGFLKKKLKSWPAEGVSFEDLRREYQGTYEELKDAIFASLSSQKPALRQVFDEKKSMMVIRKHM